MGARAPFGYMKDPDDCHKLIIDPVAAPVVRQIFQWAYEKVPLNRIVLLLNEGNYPSPGKYKMQTGEITHQALAGRGYWPVSYTHLDVYKRQVITSLSNEK